MGVAERYAQRKKEKKEDEKTGGVAYRYKMKQAERVAGEVQSRVSSWLENNETYVGNYNSRFADKKRGYVEDTADWLSTARKQKTDFDTEAAAINSILDDYEGIFDKEWSSSIRRVLKQNGITQAGIVSTYQQDDDYMKQFGSREKYDVWKAGVDRQKAIETMDIDTAQKELDALKSDRDEAAPLLQEIERLTTLGNQRRSRVTGEMPTDIQTEIERLTQTVADKYGDVEELCRQIDEKQPLLHEAKQWQKGNALKTAAVEAPDYAEKSRYVSTESKGFLERLDDQYGMGYNDLEYEYINGDDAFREKIESRAQDYAGDISTRTESVYAQKGLHLMTDEEIGVYNYYYATGGKEKATEYLETLEDRLSTELAQKQREAVEGRAVAQVFYGFAAGLDQFSEGMKNLFNTEEYIPPTAVQKAGAMIREDLKDTGPQFLGSSVGQMFYDTASTTANMAPSILTSLAVGMINPVAGEAVGATLIGASSAGNAYAEAINSGYDKGQARVYSTLVGASEAGLQYILGGIGKLGGKVAGKSVEAVAKGVDKAIGRFALRFGGSILSEGGEEYLQEILDPYFKNFVFNENNKVDWEQAAYNGVLGALTAGILEGPGHLAGVAQDVSNAKKIMKTEGGVAKVKQVASTFAADSLAYRLAGKVDENTGAIKLAGLLHEMNGELSEQNRTDLKNALMERGMQENDAGTIAKWLGKAVEGGTYTKTQAAMLEENAVVSDVFREVIVDRNSTVNQRLQGMSEMYGENGQYGADLSEDITPTVAAEGFVQQQQAGREVSRLLRRGQQNGGMAAIERQQAEADNARIEKVKEQVSSVSDAIRRAESGDTVSDTGRTVLKANGKPVVIRRVVAIDNGKATLELDSGETVGADEVLYANEDEGLLYVAVLAIEGMTAEAANGIIRQYSRSGTVPVRQYVLGVEEAYRYGWLGAPADSMPQTGYAVGLTEADRTAAYSLGVNAGKSLFEAEQKAVNGKKKSTAAKPGKVHYGDIKKESLTDRQKASVEMLEAMAEVLGVTFHLFESKMDANGRRVGENGRYDQKDGSIHLDIHAGMDGTGVMLYTAAHELTHFIRQWSPAKFKVFADFLLAEYGKRGVPVEAMVRQQQQKAKLNGRSLSYVEAYEEMVADACETMLLDKNVVKKLQELKQKDKSLWEKIKDFFAELFNRVRRAYADLEPDSAEGKLTAEIMRDTATLQELFADALVDAGQSYQAAAITADRKDTGIRLSDRIENYPYSMQTVIREYLESVDDGLLDFIRAQKHGMNSRYKLANPTERQIKEIKDLLGIDVTGYVNLINTNAVLHIKKRHGEKGKADTSMSNDMDIARMSYVLENYDYIGVLTDEHGNVIKNSEFKSSNNEVAPMVIYSKKINGTYYLVEAVPETSSKRIWVASAYINKKKEAVKQVLNPNENQTIGMSLAHPASTVEKGTNTPMTTTNTSVAQNNPGVNTQSMQNGENNAPDGTKKSDRVPTLDTYMGSLAKDMLEDYTGLRRNYVKQQFQKLTQLTREEYLADMSDSRGYGDIKAKQQAIITALADELAAHARVEAADDTLQDVKKFVRKTRIYVDERIREDVGADKGGWNAFRKSMIGNMVFANDGISADTLYEELSDLYGEAYFPSSIVSAADRVARIADIVTRDHFETVTELTEEEVRDMAADFNERIRRFVDSAAEISFDMEASNRSLLANALEGAAQNSDERRRLKEYREKIAGINAEERQLEQVNAQLKALSFRPGARNTEEIRRLQEEKTVITNRLNVLDRSLLRLEATQPLQSLLRREKQRVAQRMKQRGKAMLANQRAQASEKIDRIMQHNRESRQAAADQRNRTEMKGRIERLYNELNRLLLKGTKEKNVKIQLSKTVAEALASINMTSRDTAARLKRIDDRIEAVSNTIQFKQKSGQTDENAVIEMEELQDYREVVAARGNSMKERLAVLNDAYKEILESSDPLMQQAASPEIAEKIKTVQKLVGDTPLRDMTSLQLTAVWELLSTVKHTLVAANRSFAQAKSMGIAEMGDSAIDEVKNVGGENATRRAILSGADRLMWNNMKPVYAFDYIGSPTMQALFDTVRKGEDVWAVDVSAGKQFYDRMGREYHTKDWDWNKPYTFKAKNGTEFSLTLEQVLAMYAYSRRDQAMEHLTASGFVFDDAIEVVTEIEKDAKTGKKKKVQKTQVNIKKAFSLSTQTVRDIVAVLTEEQRQYADKMQAYLSEVMGEKGNEVALKMYGIKLYKEKYYFPIKSAKQFMYERNEVAGDRRIKNAGFSQNTIQHAKNPIILGNFRDIWCGHVNDMSMYHAFVLPLEDFNRVFNYHTPYASGVQSVKEVIESAYGKEATAYIHQLLTDLNGGARVDRSTAFADKMLANWKKAKVAVSASVVIQQPSAIVRAFAVVDAKYFATKPVVGRVGKTWELMNKYAPITIIKDMGRFDVNMGMSTVEWMKQEHYKGRERSEALWKDKDYRTAALDDAMGSLPGMADKIAWCQIWAAVEKETADTTDLKRGTEAFYKAVGERFTEVIVKTQVYDSVLARSPIMRSQQTFAKMATAFMAESTTTANMLLMSVKELQRGKKKYAFKTIAAVAASVILNAAMASVVYAGRDDDDSKTYLEKYVGHFADGVLSGLNPLNMIPLGKDIMSLLEGYDVERTDMALVSSLIETLQKLPAFIEKALNGEATFEEWVAYITDLAGDVADMFGIPLNNAVRDLKGLYNTFFNTPALSDTDSDMMWEAVREQLPFAEEKTKGQLLYEAMVRDDAGLVERISGQFKTEQAMRTAVRKALRENDSRILSAAEAKAAGDMRTMADMLTAIKNEGHFSQDDIVKAMNAEYDRLAQGEGEEEDTQEDTEEVEGSIYTVSDVNATYESGDDDMAMEMIADILAAKERAYLASDTFLKKHEKENPEKLEELAAKQAETAVRSSMTRHWKKRYQLAYADKDDADMKRIREILLKSGMYGRAADVSKTVRGWIG